VGQGTSTEILSDDEIDECLLAGLLEVNLRDPLWFFSSFTTVANTQRYSIAAMGITTKIGPLEVFWRPGAGDATCSTPGIFSSLGDLHDFILSNILGGAGQIPYIDEAALELNARFNSTLQRYLGGRGWEENDGFVYLEPRPGSGGEAVYFYAPIERFGTAVAVTREYSEALMSFAEYKAALLCMSKQSEVKAARMGGGKSVETMGGEFYWKMAETAKRRFEDSMVAPPDIHIV
jgi:hypothetical protein